jgi:Fe-S cluster biogenesis protein NfuA
MNISPVVDDGVNLLQAALKTYILIFLRGVRLADLLPDAATTHTDRTHSPSRPIPHRMSCTDQADNKVLKSAAKGYAMFIETEATPNPATLKFNPGRMVGGDRTHQFSDPSAAAGSPLARRLFAIDQITAVFFGPDFITATKTDAVDWPTVKPVVLGVIMEHYVAGDPLFDVETAETGHSAAGEDSDLVNQIKELLDTRVRPAVAQDGGDIVFRSFQDGVVSLHLQGSCAGCPSSTATLKAGIENMLRHYLPEVTEVRAV